jgi:hypothetical protein
MFAAPLWPIISAALAWLLRQVLVKFVVLSACFAVIGYFLPLVWAKVQPFTSINLASFFTALPPGVWYFLDLARLDFGLPLMLSAIVARFIIRRLPMVG